MERHVFGFSLIIEGATEKVLQFTMPLKSYHIRNIGFNEQKCIFEHPGKVETTPIFTIKTF